MPTHYTESGDIIRNPGAYAKTGAPMYKSKYGNTKDINQETYIYKMNCQYGKKYIGKTIDVDRRMNQHFSGNGAQVTQKFKPTSGKVIDVCPGYHSDSVEQYHTEKNMDTHGYENVRGGTYVNSKTLHANEKRITCFTCGKQGHYSNKCYQTKGNDSSDEEGSLHISDDY
jgi:hypothetical protein